MKSHNSTKNALSPRRNDINEDNLNFLNEEASQYLDEQIADNTKSKSLTFQKKSTSN